MTMRHKDIAPTHPGALLRETVLPALPFGKAELARRLHISRQHLYDILNEKQPVTPETAMKFGKIFGNGAGLWLRMQTNYDLWKAERSVDVSNIETFKDTAADPA